MFNCLCLDTSTLSQVAKFDGVVLEIYGVSQIDYYFLGGRLGRSSHSHMFFIIGILKYFAIFIGKHFRPATL